MRRMGGSGWQPKGFNCYYNINEDISLFIVSRAGLGRSAESLEKFPSGLTSDNKIQFLFVIFIGYFIQI